MGLMPIWLCGLIKSAEFMFTTLFIDANVFIRQNAIEEKMACLDMLSSV